VKGKPDISFRMCFLCKITCGCANALKLSYRYHHKVVLLVIFHYPYIRLIIIQIL